MNTRDHFGALRSLMQRDTLDEAERAELWRRVERAASLDPSAFVSRVAPYLAGFPHHFDEPLATVEDVDALERAVDRLPSARFVLRPASRASWDRPSAALRRVSWLDLSYMGERFEDPTQWHLPAHVDGRAMPELVRLTYWRRYAAEAAIPFRELQAARLFDGLTHLTLVNPQSPLDVDALVDEPALSRLEHLRLGVNVDFPYTFGKLYRAPHLKALKTLEVEHIGLLYNRAATVDNEEWPPTPGELVASACTLGGLEELVLSNRRFSSYALSMVAQPGILDGLKRLSLRGCELRTGLSHLEPAGALPRLERLDLSGNAFRDDAVASLARSPGIPRLAELELSGNPVTAAGVLPWLAQARRETLRVLDLSGCALDETSRRAIRGAATPRQLVLEGDEVA